MCIRDRIKNERMFSAYIQALRKCPSWEDGNTLFTALSGIEKLSAKQADDLVVTYNETKRLQGSFAFNGSKERFYGSGLVSYLNRMGPRQFHFKDAGTIELIKVA